MTSKRSLQRALDELERTDPAVAAASRRVDETIDRIVQHAVVHVRVPTDVTDAMARCAERDDITQTEFIRRALCIAIFTADERAEGHLVGTQVVDGDKTKWAIWPWERPA